MNNTIKRTNNQDIEPYVLTSKEAAKFLSIAPGTLANWRSQGAGPRYFRPKHGNPNSPVLYRVSDLKEWVDSHYYN